MKKAFVTLMFAAMLMVCVTGCDLEEAAAKMQQYEADVARLEAKYGPLLDDPNAAAGAAGELIKRQLALELKKVDLKYGAMITDPNGRLQRGVSGFDRYTPAVGAVVSVMPTPVREIGLAALGIAGTIAGALRSRRKWKGVSDELLYARNRLEKRIEASGLDTETFKVQRDKAEGEALNPSTVKLIS